MSVEFLSLAEGSLAYQRQFGDVHKCGIVFLGGFASDMTGTKAAYLAGFCAQNNLSFVRFDYRGCGQSAGKFTDQTIGGWLADSLAVFDRLTEGPQIIVGSSMGGWLGLLLAAARPERVKAFVGVAAAPDFTEELVWDVLTAEQRAALLRDGQICDPTAPPDHRVPMTLKLIEEARMHLVFAQDFVLPCPALLLQGKKDPEVPWEFAEKIAAHVKAPEMKVVYREDGDHRLSKAEDLDVMGRLVEGFI